MNKTFTTLVLILGGFSGLFAQDLTPKSISFNYDFQTALITNLQVEVENLDNFSVLSDYRIEVEVNGIGTVSCLGVNYQVDWFNVGGVNANSTKTYNLPDIDLDAIDNTCGLPTGNYHLKVILDVDDDVSEDDENNNTASYTNDAFPFESLATAVEDADLLKDVRIYPNPAQGQFSVDRGAIIGDVQMEIVSIEGKVLLSEVLTGQYDKQSIDLAGFRPGLYLVRFVTEGQHSVKKLLVQ